MDKRIKEIRSYYGETQEVFANKIGVSKISVAYYESGKRSPSPALIELICSKYGISKRWLIEGSGEMLVSMTRDEEIAAFIGQIQLEDNFKNRFIAALSKLDESEWKAIEHLVDMLIEEKKGP